MTAVRVHEQDHVPKHCTQRKDWFSEKKFLYVPEKLKIISTDADLYNYAHMLLFDLDNSWDQTHNNTMSLDLYAWMKEEGLLPISGTGIFKIWSQLRNRSTYSSTSLKEIIKTFHNLSYFPSS